MTIKIERVPETDRMEDWRDFETRVNELANQGYELTHSTTDYIILQRK